MADLSPSAFRAAGLGALRIVICGGGASAVLLAHALAKAGGRPLDITIVERRERAGLGLAYSTSSDRHLLNVPATRMSADQDDTDHFGRWLAVWHHVAPDTAMNRYFAPRRVYGEYLCDVLDHARRPHVRISVVTATAISASPKGARWRVALSDRRELETDILVLATGHGRQRPVPSQSFAPRIIEDPWDAKALDVIAPDSAVLLLGTGLTAIDVVLSLGERGHTGPIAALSRHRLLPQRHALAKPRDPWLEKPYPASISKLLALVRRALGDAPDAAEIQAVLDGIRPVIPELWQGFDDINKRRFLRHLHTRWNVWRHRVAPQIADEVEALIAGGRLELVKGRLTGLQKSQNGATFDAIVKCRGWERRLSGDYLVNCTGPSDNPFDSQNVLVHTLIREGLARPGGLLSGLDVDERCRLVARDGRRHDNLFAIGPLTKGRFWEVTAIPDIRAQASRLARETVATVCRTAA